MVVDVSFTQAFLQLNKKMEEIYSKIFTACIVANIPLIAKAVVEELKAQPQDIRTVSRQEAAKSLGISLPTLDNLIKDGTLRAVKAGRRVVIKETEIQSLLESGISYKYLRKG